MIDIIHLLQIGGSWTWPRLPQQHVELWVLQQSLCPVILGLYWGYIRVILGLSIPPVAQTWGYHMVRFGPFLKICISFFAAYVANISILRKLPARKQRP